MARITIYDAISDRNYSINMELARSYRMSDTGATEEEDVYIIITTDILLDGVRRPPYIVRDLSDVPSDGGPATASDFNDLFERWILWIKEDGELGKSSSSNSSNSSSSSS
jgi:hypothetical protein